MDKVSEEIDQLRWNAKVNTEWAIGKLRMLDPTSYGSTGNEISEAIMALESALRDAKKIQELNQTRRA